MQFFGGCSSMRSTSGQFALCPDDSPIFPSDIIPDTECFPYGEKKDKESSHCLYHICRSWVPCIGRRTGRTHKQDSGSLAAVLGMSLPNRGDLS